MSELPLSTVRAMAKGTENFQFTEIAFKQMQNICRWLDEHIADLENQISTVWATSDKRLQKIQSLERQLADARADVKHITSRLEAGQVSYLALDALYQNALAVLERTTTERDTLQRELEGVRGAIREVLPFVEQMRGNQHYTVLRLKEALQEQEHG